MSDMITVASGFQYSVNIAYDLGNNEKLQNFIPTKSALALLEEILQSTTDSATERARILIGAYGKGKSHIVLMILSMLMQRDLTLFEKTLPKLKENERLHQSVLNYYESGKRILPVVITGSSTSLSQSFLVALQRTLTENDLLDIMPETNYKAAVSVIERWKVEFPDTYSKLQSSIGIPMSKFTEKLLSYDSTAYEQFERIYPSLTAGTRFNPFLGFDVVELYENAVKGLKNHGYSGIYVIYDEFSKYLEANITEASVSDTKMLQDFAEKCNRSGASQLHLMLISHKEISNYIDKLPKKKVDGWRGVSERFKHIHLNNNFSQTYEIISSVIQRDSKQWSVFCQTEKNRFQMVMQRYIRHNMFLDDTDELNRIVYLCYPLHPVSTFILPRLSERVAQNERTLFTFLSAEGQATLSDFLAQNSDDQFTLITPDYIYDYFEPLFKKELYSDDLRQNYQLTNIVLSKLKKGSLESKIVKTLSLIYILEQFEKIKPSKEELVGIYTAEYSEKDIEAAIDNLIEKEYVVYLKRSNNHLKLKQSTGVDVAKKIKDLAASLENKFSLKHILNSANFDNYMYPSRYNDEREITRYFSFEFIEESEIQSNVDWEIKSENESTDGIIYGILVNPMTDLEELRLRLLSSSQGYNRHVFVCPKNISNIREVALEYTAVSMLRDSTDSDALLFEEYDVVYEDLQEVIRTFIASYTHPERFKSIYIHNGNEQKIYRKAALTGLMSDICDQVYSLTPQINNEAINRNEVTSIAANSRHKIVAALLRSELEKNLGLTGSGQEVSIMRGTLIRTGILTDIGDVAQLNLAPADVNMSHLLRVIVDFINEAKNAGKLKFDVLYNRLTKPTYHIGLRKGLIPIYIAVVFHKYRQELIIEDDFAQVALNADTLTQINANPASFTLSFLDWDRDKEEFIGKLSEIFEKYCSDVAQSTTHYDYVVVAMKRWYMSLPKYAKELKVTASGEKVDRRYTAFIRALRQGTGSHELLFEKLPIAFGYSKFVGVGLVENIASAKKYFDNAILDLQHFLCHKVKAIFADSAASNQIARMSLSSVIKDWCDALDPDVFNQLFADGTDKCLGLFQTVTNDEEMFISRLSKIATDLRIEDWDASTINRFVKQIETYKATAIGFKNNNEPSMDVQKDTNMYQLVYTDENGVSITKRFGKVESSKRSSLLCNMILADLDSMGNSITESEKRQVLMEILKQLC